MKYELSFWGGPKDGGTVLVDIIPPEEIFCFDDSSPLLTAEEVQKLLLLSNVEQPFAVYEKDKRLRNKFKFKFIGLL